MSILISYFNLTLVFVVLGDIVILYDFCVIRLRNAKGNCKIVNIVISS